MSASSKKTKLPRREISEYERGVRAAAGLASEYDGCSSHPLRLEDCILGKLNMLEGRPRRNKRVGGCVVRGCGNPAYKHSLCIGCHAYLTEEDPSKHLYAKRSRARQIAREDYEAAHERMIRKLLEDSDEVLG